jgi:hypothetical protein
MRRDSILPVLAVFGLILASAVHPAYASGLAAPTAAIRIRPTSGSAGSNARVQVRGIQDGCPYNNDVTIEFTDSGGITTIVGGGTGPDFTVIVTVPATASLGIATVAAHPWVIDPLNFRRCIIGGFASAQTDFTVTGIGRGPLPSPRFSW